MGDKKTFVYFDFLVEQEYEVNGSDSVNSLVEKVCKRNNLTNNQIFDLFERNENNFDLPLEKTQNIIELRNTWESANSKSKLYFKYSYVVKQNLLDADQNTLAFIFKMAQDIVLQSRRILNPFLIYIELAALKLQIQDGDYNENKHLNGYVLNNLAQYLPTKLILQDSLQEQEDSIFRTYKQLKGKDIKQATLDYINAAFPVEAAMDNTGSIVDDSDIPEQESKEDSIPENKPQEIHKEQESLSISMSRARSFTLSNAKDIRLESLRSLVVKAVEEIIVSLNKTKESVAKSEKKEDIIPHVLLLRSIEMELPVKEVEEEEIQTGSRGRRGTVSGLGLRELHEYVIRKINAVITDIQTLKEQVEAATSTDELIQPAQIIKKITKIKS